MKDPHLKVGANNIDEVIKRLRANDPTLTHIEYDPYQGPQEKWSDAAHQTETLSRLADSIALNSTLKTFKLHARIIPGAVSGRIMGRLLARSRGLETLDLCCLDMEAAGARELAKGLAANNTLVNFKTSHGKIGDAGMAAICKALEKNTGLRSVNIGYEEIGNGGAKAFADLLRTTKTLLHFALPDNKIGAEGMGSILDALAVNTSVENADLGKANMQLFGGSEEKSDGAYRKLLDMVRKNKTIVSLNLGFTSFSAMSKTYRIEDFGAALAKNTTIAELGLDVWGMFPEYLTRFANGLKGNKSLAFLWGIDGNGLRSGFGHTDPALQAMAAVAKANPNFVLFYHGDNDSALGTALEENRERARALIEKITGKSKLTAADAKQIKESVNGIYRLAFMDESRRTERDAAGFYVSHEIHVPLARKYAYGVLETADRKLRAAGLGGIAIPEMYYPAERKVDAVKKSFAATSGKVDFSKVDLKKAFAKAAGPTSLPAIAYKAGLAGQVDELVDALGKQGLALGSRELLYRPGKDEFTLAEVISLQGKIARVMTVENWKGDLKGLDRVVALLPPAALAAQLEGRMSPDELKWEIESGALRQGRAPIRIQMRPK